MAEPRPPPLRAFFIACLVVLPIAVGVERFFRLKTFHNNAVVAAFADVFYAGTLTPVFPRGRYFGEHVSYRLGRRDASTAPAVIAIGTSRLLAGLVPEDRFEDLFRPQAIRFAAIGRPGPDWQPLKVVEVAVDAKPQVLVIERNLLFCFRGVTEDFIASLDWFGRERLYQWRQGNFDGRLDARPVRDDIDQAPYHGLERTDVFKNRVRVFDEAFRPLLARAVRNGTRIIVVDTPAFRATVSVGEAGLDAATQREAERLGAEIGFETAPCPLIFLQGDYYDGRHLWRAGRKQYSRWLVEVLQRPQAPEASAQ